MVAAKTAVMAGTIVEAVTTVQCLAGHPLSNATSSRHLHISAPQPFGALPHPVTLPLAQTTPPVLSEIWHESVSVSNVSWIRMCAGQGHEVHETGRRSGHAAVTRNAHAAGIGRTSVHTAVTRRRSTHTAKKRRRNAHAAETGRKKDPAAGIANTTTHPVTSAVTKKKKTSTERGRRKNHTSTKTEIKSAGDGGPPAVSHHSFFKSEHYHHSTFSH